MQGKGPLRRGLWRSSSEEGAAPPNGPREATKLTIPLCEPCTELSGHVGCTYISIKVKTTHEDPRVHMDRHVETETDRGHGLLGLPIPVPFPVQ